MSRRRGPFGTFLFIGFGVLLGAAIFGGVGAVGSVFLAPFVLAAFVLKIFLFILLMKLVVRLVARRGSERGHCWSGRVHHQWTEMDRPQWRSRRGPSTDNETSTADDRFEEWHRMAHARKEVDDHTPPFEG